MNIQSPLERMLKMAKAEGSATKAYWDIQTEEDYLTSQQTRSDKQPLEDIVRDIAIAASIDPEVIKGRKSSRDVNSARRVAAIRAKDQGHTLKEIGAFLGDRDTSTVYRMVATAREHRLRGTK